MTGRDWDRARDRSRIVRQGAESIDGAGVVHGSREVRKAKVDLRSEITAALPAPGATITKIVVCKCGRYKTISIPIARLGARFRCQSCGEVTS